jgi:hypothetical protein
MDKVPASLEAAIKADLAPVRRLRPPSARVLWLTPLALFTLVAASRIFSLREDVSVLGWALTWGTSVLQMALALALIAVALRHAIPGRSMRPSAFTLTVGLAAALVGVVTLRTWNVSPITIRFAWVEIGQICFVGTFVSALPLLVASVVLAGRAFSVRPWSSGALYGLGAGIGADAGWRLYCHFSDPAHVFPTHSGGILAVAVSGMLISGAMIRWKARA